jgi:general secretion pathway protein G
MRRPSHPRTRTTCGGFTLTEVIVTVALVALLLAIGLPSYLSFRDKTKTRQASVDVATMSTTIQAFRTENRALPTNLADVKLADRKDPWGRAYVYYNVAANGRGGARKDRALNPINTDFDLYSVGPDGVSKPQVTQKDSVDDVIRANNGGYIGVAADF